MKTITKDIILAIIAMSIIIFGQSLEAKGQTIKRDGNNFSSAKSPVKKASNAQATNYTWTDSKGTSYPIIVNPDSGRCYVMRVSGKTGSEYKYYLPEEVCREVCKELGIEYKTKTK